MSVLNVACDFVATDAMGFAMNPVGTECDDDVGGVAPPTVTYSFPSWLSLPDFGETRERGEEEEEEEEDSLRPSLNWAVRCAIE